jgi:glycerol-3-phosphate dehydrogenase (NAD(P)+)
MQNNKKSPGKITVLGAGAWGTAVAIALAARHDVLLWGRNADAMRAIAASSENRGYLPGFPLPPALAVSADFDAAVAHAAEAAGATPLLIAACPVAGLRPLLEQLKPYPVPNVVWLCKGFENGTGLLPHQVVRAVLGDRVPGAALSGPSFAQEVARGLPCALTVASDSAALRERVVSVVHGGNIRVYSSDDLVGDLSRNRRVGLELARGKRLETIVAELGHVAEGVPCARAVRDLAAQLGVDMPITNAVAGVLFDGDDPRAMVAQLLARDPRGESA